MSEMHCSFNKSVSSQRICVSSGLRHLSSCPIDLVIKWPIDSLVQLPIDVVVLNVPETGSGFVQ